MGGNRCDGTKQDPTSWDHFRFVISTTDPSSGCTVRRTVVKLMPLLGYCHHALICGDSDEGDRRAKLVLRYEYGESHM